MLPFPYFIHKFLGNMISFVVRVLMNAVTIMWICRPLWEKNFHLF